MNSDKLVDIFFNADNPIFFILLFIIVIILVFYFIHKYVRLPDIQKHRFELNEAELKNTRLMAMFAELDPDPVIRIDIDGKIIKTNDAASSLLSHIYSKDVNIKEILPEIDFLIRDFIKKDKSKNFFHIINGKYYSISFKGISYLDIAQLYFNDLTERLKFEDQLKSSQNQLKQMMLRNQHLIEEERQRLARELHDGIGQSLVVMKMSVANALENATNKIERDYFSKQIKALENTISELKLILYNLKPRVLEELGLEAAVKVMSNKVKQEFSIEGHTNFIGLEERLDEKQEIDVYRIIQEALNNIVKHSKASEFDINVISEDGRIRLLISDDGIGFNSEESILTSKGFGLRGMKERIESNSGTFNIESSGNTGTLIIVELLKKRKKSGT